MKSRKPRGSFRQVLQKSFNRARARVAEDLRAVKRGGEAMSEFSRYEYRKQPGFDMNTFEGANQAIPMKTLVIHCVDPRAADIPQAVATYLGDEVYLECVAAMDSRPFRNTSSSTASSMRSVPES
jgi:hypothetical protein